MQHLLELTAPMSADQHLEHARAHLIDVILHVTFTLHRLQPPQATKHGNHRSVELAILDLNRAIFLRPRDPKAYAIRGDSFSRLYDLLSAGSISAVAHYNQLEWR